LAGPYLNGRRYRLKGYDYEAAAGYFVTLCTAERDRVLSDIHEGTIVLTVAGDAVLDTWQALEARFPSIMTDDYFCVMPNHVHGIVFLGAIVGTTRGPRLSEVIGAFKSLSAIAGNRALGRNGAPFWQRSFYERIIRNDAELERIRAYIANNPYNWNEDENNPDHVSVPNDPIS
jgi:REP element-mobilizing transposase RayT